MLAFVLQLHQELFVHLHFSLSLVLRVSSFFHKLLIDIVFYVELGSSPPDSVLVGRAGTVVGSALKQGQDSVNHKENHEDVVKIESPLLALPLGSEVIELITTSR